MVGKNQMPFYNEIANIPLIICHPELAHKAGTRSSALTQTTDLMPTLLDIFGAAIPEDVTATASCRFLMAAQSEFAMWRFLASMPGR